MGLDIHIGTDNYNEVYSIEFYTNKKEFYLKMSLSREFCNLMCNQLMERGTPEFSQVAEFVGVDISPILDMNNYWDEESAEDQLSRAETEEDKQRITNKMQADNNYLQNNIDKVLETVRLLVDKLSKVDNLKKKVKACDEDTIGIDYYFSDFTIDKGEGYIGNNFGQDLRNFQRFLEYAKSKGSMTVYFNYG